MYLIKEYCKQSLSLYQHGSFHQPYYYIPTKNFFSPLRNETLFLKDKILTQLLQTSQLRQYQSIDRSKIEKNNPYLCIDILEISLVCQSWAKDNGNKLYSNMSLGHQIDFTRILGDNQRFQRDLSLAHGQINHLRSQLDRSIADNNAMREYINRLQRQKQEDINKFIATHQQLYEVQLDTLRREMEIIKSQKQSSGQNIVQLQEEIARHEEEKSRVLKQFVSLKDMLKQMEQQSNRKLKNKIQEKQEEILALTKKYDEQEVELEQSNYQRAIFQKKAAQLEAQINEIKIRSQTIEQQYKAIREKTGQRLLFDLQQARSEINKLNNQLLAKQVGKYADDNYVFENIKRLHEQISSLRSQLASAKDANSTDQLKYHQKTAQISSEKIRFEADILKKQKDFIICTQQRDRLKVSLSQCRQKLKQFSQQKEKIQNLQQQIAVLKIKVFVLEAIRTSSNFKRQTKYQSTRKDHQTNFLIAMKNRNSIIEIIQQFRIMQAIVDQTADKLRQEELKRRQYSKKSKDYKLRWETVNKRENQSLRMMERYRSKQQQYQRLVEKLQEELEKAYTMNIQVNDKNNYHLLIAPYQQKLQMATNQILNLQGTVKKMESQLRKIGDAYEASRQKLNLKISQLQKQNSQLSTKSNNLEKQLLQKQLNSVRGRSSKDTNDQYAQKVAAMIVTEQQLRKIRDELQSEKQRTQQLSATISKLKLQNSTLNSKISQYNHYPQDINLLKNKLLVLESKPQDKSNPVDFSVLYDKIEKCTQQLVSARLQKEKLQKQYVQAMTEKQQYYYRALQLEEYLSGIRHDGELKNEELIHLRHDNQRKDEELARLKIQSQSSKVEKAQLRHQSQTKNEEVVRLNQENNALLKLTDKLKEEIANLHTTNSNDREIDLMRRVKELESAKQLFQRELAQEKLKSMSIIEKIQTKENENKDLWNQICGLKISIKQYQSVNKQAINTTISDRQRLLQEENISVKNKLMLIQKEKEKIKQNIDTQNGYNILLQELTGLKQSLNFLQNKNKEQKQIFNNQSDKYENLIKELRAQIQFLNNHKPRYSNSSQKERQDSRINLLASQNIEQPIQTFNLRSKVRRLEEEILLKNDKIQQLQRNQSRFEASADMRSYSDPNQIKELRNKVQQLEMERVGLKNQVRVLEQENRELSVNRILKAHQQDHGQVYSNQTFGPSQSLQKIQQLRQPENIQGNVENQDQIRRRQQILCLLVLAWTEIQSLREEMSRRDEQYQLNYEGYLQKLRQIESHYNTQENEQINIGLLKQLQCIHKHLLPIPKYTIIKDRRVELSDLGSFTESVTGANMIESRQVNEDEDSFASHNIIN